MKHIIFILLFWATNAFAGFADLQFGRYQIADSQWNVGSCLYTNSCQIYSKNPGVMYKIPWTSGQWSWGSGQYLKFIPSGNASFPWTGRMYNSDGTVAGSIGTGKVVNLGTDANGKAYFFFVGSDNNTGQLFSMSLGMNNTSGLTFTGTLNPNTTVLDTYATTYGSTTPLASGQTASTAPSLCCGGSAAQFNANATHINMVNSFVNRGTNDSQVYITQIGDANTIAVTQTGTTNNYTYYSGNGSNNDISVTQSGNASTQSNYSHTTLTGSSNDITVTQTSTGGAKGAFVNVQNNNNAVSISQTDSGSHYAEVGLSGGNKSVNIQQSGSASQMASVQLSGNPTSLSLQQSGTTQNFYSIQFNCATAGGCSPITVKQGN